MSNTWCCVLALLFSGCADLDNYAAGQCGNNVVDLEAGEDCDLIPDPSLGDGLACGPPDGTAQACRYSCVGTRCPTGWACGDDQICRPPSGMFDESDAPDLVLGAQEIALQDVIGTDAAQLIARIEGDVFVFTEDDDRLVEAFAVSIPNLRGAFSFAEVNGDGGVELVVPAGSRALGVAALPRVHVLEGDGERWGTAVAPSTLQDDLVVGLAPLRGDPTTGDTLLRLTRIDATTLQLEAVPTAACPESPPSSSLLLEDTPATTPLLTSAHVPALGLDWISVSGAGDSRVTLVEGEQRCDAPPACNADAPRQPCSASVRVAQTLDVGGALGPTGCHFGDVDGDTHLDLVCALSDGRLRLSEGDPAAWSPFGDLLADDALFDATAGQSRSCAPQNALLAVHDLNADGLADLVTPHGVFVGTEDGYRQRYARTLGDAWGSAAVGDFDRDGALEVALTVLRDGESCAPVLLEVLSPTQSAYSSTIVPNASAPHQLRAGDFDGDGIDDLAAFEGSAELARAVVFFGDTKEPLEDKASVDGFEDARALVPVVWNDGVAANPDLITDLAIIANGGAGLTLLQGTTRRAMLSPLAFGSPTSEMVHPVSALVGPLLPGAAASDTDAASDDGPDDDDDDAPTPDMLVTAGTTAWLLPGAALPDTSDAVPLDISGAALNPACTLWSSGQQRDETTGALLVGLDGIAAAHGTAETNCATSNPPSLVLARFEATGEGDTLVMSAAATLSTAGSATAVQVFDVDGSGRDDVMVHVSAADGGVGALLWMQDPEFVSEGEPPGLENVVAAHDVLAVAPLNANRDSDRELAILTDTGVRILSWAGAEFDISDPVLELPPRPRGDAPPLLVSGDTSGDGVADLGLLWGDAIYLYSAVLRP